MRATVEESLRWASQLSDAWEAAHDERLAAECPAWVADAAEPPATLIQDEERAAEIAYEIFCAERLLREQGRFIAPEDKADLCEQIDSLHANRAARSGSPRHTWRVSQVVKATGVVVHRQDIRTTCESVEKFAETVREVLDDNRYQINIEFVEDEKGESHV